jgi:hypothetical protein
MTKDSRSHLSLDRSATYQIQVPGMIDLSRVEWASNMEIFFDREGEGPPIATLTGDLDQAALHGLLRRLYSLGLPLISVIWISGD